MKKQPAHQIIIGGYKATITKRKNGSRIPRHYAVFTRTGSPRSAKAHSKIDFDANDIPRLFEIMSLAHAWMWDADRKALKEFCK